MMSKKLRHEGIDLVVIGGGSAGIAAALAAGRQGLKVVIVERGARLGGTATQGGVNCWEMGIGGTGIPFDIYRRMKQQVSEVIGVYSYGRHFCWQDGWHWPHALDKVSFPGGELLIDSHRRYLDTLRRHPGSGQRPTEAWCRENWHGIPFLPEVMEAVLQTMIEETGNVTVRLKTAFTKVHALNGRVEGVTLDDGTELRAAMWIDSAGGAVCHALSCETLRGADPRCRFNESGAPAEVTDEVNGVTLIYKVMPGYTEAIEPLPPGVPSECWWGPHFPPMSCVQYPNMGRNCNMLPTMQGKEYVALGCQAAYDECVRRVKAYWHFLQTHWPEFRTYRMTWIAPMLGIREDRRVVCERMLTENDILCGLNRQTDPDIVTLTDHPFDRHGEGGGCGELDEPYGVPYRCLIPKGWHNLLVAGRAAGFSSIAASSCRLTRTMMQLGQAAGTAIVLGKRGNLTLPDVNPHELRENLRRQHVQLEWPMSEGLTRHLSEETDRK
jgi:hypothetical protein